MKAIWLNIGCGKQHLRGFVNMDIEQPYDVRLDARKGLPYPDKTVDGIYSEHFFEHLSQTEGSGFLRECRRVLKPGGVVRIAMPDLDTIIDRYVSEDWRGDGDMFKFGYDWVVNRCEMMNIAMRDWGHKHLYNEEELTRIARLAGLEPVARYENGKSGTPEFVGLETRNSSKLNMEFAVPDRTVEEQPLISILISAGRTDWYEQALSSALQQTYPNIEIIVFADPASVEIERITDELAAGDARMLNIVRNSPSQGRPGSYAGCLSLARGKFIIFLGDDELLYPACLERMLAAYRDRPAVTLVTSYRKKIDEGGDELPDLPEAKRLAKEDCEIEGVSCASAMLRSKCNFIGGPAGAMFRREDLSWVSPHIMSFGGKADPGAGEVAMWLNLLGRGNVYYIAEAMSAIREHPAARQREPVKPDWDGLIFHARRLGLLQRYVTYSIKCRQKPNDHWQVRSTPVRISGRIRLKQLRTNARSLLKRWLTFVSGQLADYFMHQRP